MENWVVVVSHFEMFPPMYLPLNPVHLHFSFGQKQSAQKNRISSVRTSWHINWWSNNQIYFDVTWFMQFSIMNSWKIINVFVAKIQKCGYWCHLFFQMQQFLIEMYCLLQWNILAHLQRKKTTNVYRNLSFALLWSWFCGLDSHIMWRLRSLAPPLVSSWLKTWAPSLDCRACLLSCEATANWITNSIIRSPIIVLHNNSSPCGFQD